MTTINIQTVRDEFCHFLRYSDVLTTSIRGVTRDSTEGYTVGAGGEATHTFGHNPVRNFKVLTVNGTAKYYLRDYTVNWTTGVLTWNSALVNNDVVVVTYDYGNGDKIYPDLPRDDLTLSSYPRIGLQLTSISTEPLGIGGSTHTSDVLFTVFVLAPANKDSNISGGFGGLSDLEECHRLVRDAIRTGAKSFYTFPWIYPSGLGPLFKGFNDKVLQQSADYQIKFRIE
jgi:hypothetical protein